MSKYYTPCLECGKPTQVSQPDSRRYCYGCFPKARADYEDRYERMRQVNEFDALHTKVE